MKKILFVLFLSACCTFGQSNPIPNLVGSGTDAVSTGASYIYNAAKGLDFSEGVSVSAAALKHHDLYGGGISIMTALTNNPVQAGVGIYSMQERDPVTKVKEWSFYTVSLQLSVSQRETIPLLNIPVDLIIGTGGGIKLAKSGDEVIEHSEALVRYSYDLRRNLTLSAFAGVIHESEFPSDVIETAGADVVLRF